jgi:hypothetical protein
MLMKLVHAPFGVHLACIKRVLLFPDEEDFEKVAISN